MPYEGEMAKKIRLDDISLTDLDPDNPEHVQLVREHIAALDRKRSLAAAVLIAAGITPPETASAPKPPSDPIKPVEVARFPKRKARSIPPDPVGPLNVMEGSHADILFTILTEFGGPVTYSELREKLAAKGHKIGKSAIYAGVQRLREKGYCVPHKGRISTRDNLKRFLAEVDAGRAVDIRVARYRNKYADAIYHFLADYPQGATFRQIVDHLAKLPEIGGIAEKNRGAYVATQLSKMRWNHTKLIVKLAKGVYQLREYAEGENKTLGGPARSPDNGEQLMTAEDSPSDSRHLN